MLTGILFFHSILFPPGDDFRLFEALCGQKAAAIGVLVTTGWLDVGLPHLAEENEKECKDVLWKGLIKSGATTQRFMDSRESALDIISPLLAKSGQSILLQEEMVDMGLSLSETTVSQLVYSELKQETGEKQRRGYEPKPFDRQISKAKVGYYRRLTLALTSRKMASVSIQVRPI